MIFPKLVLASKLRAVSFCSFMNLQIEKNTNLNSSINNDLLQIRTEIRRIGSKVFLSPTASNLHQQDTKNEKKAHFSNRQGSLFFPILFWTDELIVLYGSKDGRSPKSEGVVQFKYIYRNRLVYDSARSEKEDSSEWAAPKIEVPMNPGDDNTISVGTEVPYRFRIASPPIGTSELALFVGK